MLTRLIAFIVASIVIVRYGALSMTAHFGGPNGGVILIQAAFAVELLRSLGQKIVGFLEPGEVRPGDQFHLSRVSIEIVHFTLGRRSYLAPSGDRVG